MNGQFIQGDVGTIRIRMEFLYTMYFGVVVTEVGSREHSGVKGGALCTELGKAVKTAAS